MTDSSRRTPRRRCPTRLFRNALNGAISSLTEKLQVGYQMIHSGGSDSCIGSTSLDSCQEIVAEVVELVKLQNKTIFELTKKKLYFGK